jgi:hypothetical protein
MNWLKLLLGAAAVALSAGTAHAQATRTWVSGVGDDVNPCSRTAPCKTFAGAISKTATGGEINCLDSAGFGGVTITKSLSIICEGVTGGVLVSGSSGIVVNAPASATVLLQGLDIEGLNGTNLAASVHGVNIVGGGVVTIRKSIIRNFGQFGVRLVGTANARVLIEDSLVTNNKSGGLFVQGAAGATNNAFVNQTVIDNNGPAAVTISGPGSIILSASTLRLSTAAIAASGGGTVISYGDNVLRGTGLPNTTLPKL